MLQAFAPNGARNQGETDSYRRTVPKGMCPPAQGCRTRLPWGTTAAKPYPNGDASEQGYRNSGDLICFNASSPATPLGLLGSSVAVPKVAEYSNLGL